MIILYREADISVLVAGLVMHKNRCIQSLSLVHVVPETQVVAPVQPMPPH